MFPFPLYFNEIRFAKSVLVSAFSFLVNLFSISSGKPLAVVTFSNVVHLMIRKTWKGGTFLDIVPLKASEILHFMIIRLMRFERSHLSMSLLSSEELLSVRSAGRQPLTHGPDP